MKGLTARQAQILDFIRLHIEDHGFPPSIRELGAHFKINSTNGVIDHLRALQRKGFIVRDPGSNQKRAMRVVGQVVDGGAPASPRGKVAIPVFTPKTLARAVRAGEFHTSYEPRHDPAKPIPYALEPEKNADPVRVTESASRSRTDRHEAGPGEPEKS